MPPGLPPLIPEGRPSPSPEVPLIMLELEGRPSGVSGGRPGGMMSGGRPEGMDIDAMLAQICPKFDAERCSSIESSMAEEIDCNEMNASTRGGRKKKMLYCACCD